MVFLNTNIALNGVLKCKYISWNLPTSVTHQHISLEEGSTTREKCYRDLLVVGSPSILIVIPCWKIYVNQLMFQCVNKTLDGLNSPQVFESWKLTKRANKCTKKQQQQQFAVSDDSIIDRSGYLSMGAAMRHCQLQWGSIFQEHFTISLTQSVLRYLWPGWVKQWEGWKQRMRLVSSSANLLPASSPSSPGATIVQPTHLLILVGRTKWIS